MKYRRYFEIERELVCAFSRLDDPILPTSHSLDAQTMTTVTEININPAQMIGCTDSKTGCGTKVSPESQTAESCQPASVYRQVVSISAEVINDVVLFS